MQRRGFLLGGAVMVTAAPRASPAGPITWLDEVGVARGAGLRGPWRQNESRYDFVDDPAVALWPDGAAAVAWVDQAPRVVRVRRLRPDGRWNAAAVAQVTGRAGTFAWIPRLALAPDAPGTVYLLWQQIIFSGGSHGGEMMLARSLDAGRSFDAPRNLSASTGGDGKGRLDPATWSNGSYDLAAGAGGRLVVAWTEYDGPLWVRASADAGLRFDPPRRVAGGPGRRPARAPTLALAPDGRLLLAWTEADGAQARLQWAVSADGGASFGDARPLGPAAGHADAPRLAVDASGACHLAFAHAPAGRGGASRILHAVAPQAGADFGPSRVVSHPLPPGMGSAAYPQLALGGRGHVVIAWEAFESARAAPRGLGIAASSDGGRRFSTPGWVPGGGDAAGGRNGSSQGLLVQKLAVSARGDLLLANSSLRPGEASRVWLLRGRLAGDR